MSPQSDTHFNVSTMNGYEGSMSSEALGITACFYAYSHLSFGPENAFTEPDPLRDWVQEQIQEGSYSSSSDYVRDLIRRDRESREQQIVLQEAITAGLKSGISQRSMEDLLEEAKAKLLVLNAN